MNELNWEKILESIRGKLPEDDFNSWIVLLNPLYHNNYTAFLEVPGQFVKGWVLSNYKKVIVECIKHEVPTIEDIALSVSDTLQPSSTSADTNPSTMGPSSNSPSPKSETSSLNSNLANTPNFSNALIRRYTFDNFVVGQPNEMAYTAAKSIAESETLQPEYNPFFLHGGVGLGKTHLMHSIAWHIKKHRKTPHKIIYLSAEKFMTLYIEAIQNKSMMSFKQELRTADVLMIDDFQFISGKENTQEEFFHTFNSLIENGKQIIFTADVSPSNLVKVEPRIVSRMNGGLVTGINSTTYEFRKSLLNVKVKQNNLKIPSDVIDFLAHNITSNIRELEGALSRINFAFVKTGKKITLELIIDLLEDMIRKNSHQVHIPDLQRVVAEHYNIKLSEMLSDKRLKRITMPKQIAMYLAKELTQLSFAEIGKNFRGKDHATVLYAHKKIKALRENDMELHSDLNSLEKIIKQSS